MPHSIEDIHVTVTHQYDARPRAVWTVLSDPAVARDALPAVRSTETASDGLVPDGLGAGSVVTGEESIEEGERYAMVIASPLDRFPTEFQTYATVGEHRFPRLAVAIGGDGDHGSFDARMEVEVEETPTGTTVEWSLVANVAGEVAEVSERAIQPVLAREADRYFEAIETLVDSHAGSADSSTGST
ncbi:CoxG family protein [Haloarchaeobius sp. DFWS5]|uniref:CoxG family protein n=1 Tax=Haloarchaeobius sp. DFWS5 TaxID=3446114 RepID=UPI003EB9493A